MRAILGPRSEPVLIAIVIASCILAPQVVQARKPQPAKVRFAPVHIYLDPAGKPLAAYQFELVCSVPVRAYFSAADEDNASQRPDEHPVKIVGVEGGEHPAFKEAPYYDPAALQNERIIIAAFNTGSDLPTARTHIATIHLQITGDAEPKYALSLTTAADANGENLPVEITLEKGEQK
jgi:hypothetical protein